MCGLVSTRIKSKIFLLQLLILKFSQQFSNKCKRTDSGHSGKDNLSETMTIGKWLNLPP